MYRFDMQKQCFYEDRRPGVRETLMDMGLDGLAMYYAPESGLAGSACGAAARDAGAADCGAAGSAVSAAFADKTRVGVVIMHCDQNYMPLAMGPALAEQGYQVVACEAKEGGSIDDKLPMVSRCIAFLHEQGATSVVLMGHSGGATLMSAYQAVAERGVSVFQGSQMIWKCRAKGPFLPADGLMLIDANYGNGVMCLLSLDPAVTEEENGVKQDPQWDIFSPEHGFLGPEQGGLYPTDFVAAYRAAQAGRNDRLIDAALERMAAIESGCGNYLDDEPFVIAGGSQIKPNNRMIPQDLRILSHSKAEHDLLHGDGSVTHERIYGLRVPEFDRSFTALYGMGANKNTVKGFLSSQAIRARSGEFAVTETEVSGIDWDSSYASAVGNIRHVSVPLLVMGMTGSYEYLASEMIYDQAPMDDKTITFVRGATHVFTPNHAAEAYPGEFGDTEGALYNYLDGWLTRFI